MQGAGKWIVSFLVVLLIGHATATFFGYRMLDVFSSTALKKDHSGVYGSANHK